jgi:hypothetical protein
MRKDSSALKIFSLLPASIVDLSSDSEGTFLYRPGHEFLFENLQFRIAERTPSRPEVQTVRDRDIGSVE